MEAKAYFKQEVFQRLAKELKRRYYLNGSFGISIGLKTFSDIDLEPLRKLLGVTEVQWQKKKSITVDELGRGIESSVLNQSLREFVEALIGEELITKEMVEDAYEKRFSQFLDELIAIDEQFIKLLATKQLQDWLPKAQNNMEIFIIVSNTLNNLPVEYTRLPVFAYKMTGDPHAFDEDHPAGSLLLQVLTAKAEITEVFNNLSKTEQKNEIYVQFHLLKDDIMNFVAINGLLANKDGKPDKMWQAACQNRHSWNVPLKEILPLEKIYPATGNSVLIVENSGVYSILLDRYPKLPVICSNGQFRYAVWALLRKLVSSDVQIFYAGDMDPEGLMMADTLKNAFPENVQFLAMTPGVFKAGKSQVVLSDVRLKQLKRLKDTTLINVAAQVEMGAVTYQEATIDALIAEIAVAFSWL